MMQHNNSVNNHLLMISNC